MELLEIYQKKAYTEFKENPNNNETVAVLGLVGESGEVANVIKKEHRDAKENRKHLEEELGDVIWYVANIASIHNLNLEDIIVNNMLKTIGRGKHEN